MDELVVRNTNLPAMTNSEVKKFIDDITYNIKAIEARRKKMGEYGADQSVLDSLGWQIAQLKAIQLQAQMEFGKRSAEIEKTDHKFGNQFGIFRTAEEGKTKSKAEQLLELGITPQRAHESERLFHNKELVDQYIEDSLAEGKAPSKRGALKAIQQKETYVTEGEVDIETNFTGVKYSRLPVDRQKEIVNYCLEHENEGTGNIARLFSIGYETVEKIRNAIGQQNPNARALAKRVEKMEAEKAVYDLSDIKANEYTLDDAIDELIVMKDEFVRKVERMLDIRRSVVGGNKEVVKLITSFTDDIKSLADKVKMKGV